MWSVSAREIFCKPRPLAFSERLLAIRLLTTRGMPPKEKRRKISGQQTLRFGSSGLQLDTPVSSGESLSSPTTTVSSVPSTSSHRGSLESWRSFAQPKYQQKHPWLVLKPEGIYCQYCCAHQPRAGANVFVALPYTGN